ncbi:ABC transporter ATP-binding protein [Mucisphaera sp.]|uniref:ABC transporter ATP-binding protein n=1 Tax=Mucisphaera sp. TaxID=2913024 RepID=UPI003D13D2E0
MTLASSPTITQPGSPADATQPPVAVAIDALSHQYAKADIYALEDIQLDVQQGDFVALLGPNGSGKSTLFRILTTAITASGKPNVIPRISLLGHDLRVAADTIRQNLGVVFQSPSLDKELTVAENLRLQGRVYGLSAADLRHRVPERLDAVGLTDRANDKVKTLSGGLARRAELAKALLHNPSLLILDEPSTGVDPSARRQFWQSLHDERQRSGLTVLMTTHLIDEAEAADRVVILDQGRIVAQGTPANLKAQSGGAVLAFAAHTSEDLTHLIDDLTQNFAATPLPDRVFAEARLEVTDGPAALRHLLDHHQHRLRTTTLSEPTLEDIFERTTGTRFQTT